MNYTQDELSYIYLYVFIQSVWHSFKVSQFVLHTLKVCWVILLIFKQNIIISIPFYCEFFVFKQFYFIIIFFNIMRLRNSCYFHINPECVQDPEWPYFDLEMHSWFNLNILLTLTLLSHPFCSNTLKITQDQFDAILINRKQSLIISSNWE